MEKRYEHKADENPGVGSYQVEKPFNKTLGHMAIKLKKMTDFVNPSPSAYQPKEDLTKPLPQRAINYRSDRTDFSKSITGRSVGPGVYEVRTKEELSLGKIGTSPKFPANKNKNVRSLLFSQDQDITRSLMVSGNFRSTALGLRRQRQLAFLASSYRVCRE